MKLLTILYLSHQNCDIMNIATERTTNMTTQSYIAPEDIVTASVSKLLYRIHELQDIQSRNPYSSSQWQDASKELEPLFKRMAALSKETFGD